MVQPDGSAESGISLADARNDGGQPDFETFYQMVNLQFDGDEVNEPAMAQISVGHYLPDSWTDALSYRRPAEVQVACEKREPHSQTCPLG